MAIFLLACFTQNSLGLKWVKGVGRVRTVLPCPFREAIWYFQFRPRPPRLRESNGGQVEIENANQKNILKILVILSKKERRYPK